MVAIDYMAHQEQYSPSQLLEFAELAEQAGFDWVWTSDHFHPWFHTDAEAGFAWAWLAAAAERVDIPVGTCVTPAGEHYHPGLVAQAFATLQELNDDRVILGLSTGEAMNEKPLGHEWPEYPVRRDRLEETLEIIHELWAAEDFVDYDGDHFRLDEAYLYTTPDERPEVHIAANGPSTASLTGEYGDGFVTVKKGEEYTERLYPAVREYTREAGRDPDEVFDRFETHCGVLHIDQNEIDIQLNDGLDDCRVPDRHPRSNRVFSVFKHRLSRTHALFHVIAII